MPVLRTFLLTVFFLFLAAIIALLVFREDISAYLGAGPEHKIPIPSGNIDVPWVRLYPSSDQSVLKRGILEYWADQPFPEWAEKHKVTGPRVVLGCLMSETRIEEANAYLLDCYAAGNSGSRWRTIDYELDAAPDKWVISAVDGHAVDRDFDYWPHFSGEF